MIRQIRWYDVSEHWLPYSDVNLTEVVKEFLEEIPEPAKIRFPTAGRLTTRLFCG